MFDLIELIHYPTKLAVEGRHSRRPLHWFRYSDEDIPAEGRFLLVPGLLLFLLEDNQRKRLSDGIPENDSVLARQMPSLSFELAQAFAVSKFARELAADVPLLFIFLVDFPRRQLLSIGELYARTPCGANHDRLTRKGVTGPATELLLLSISKKEVMLYQSANKL